MPRTELFVGNLTEDIAREDVEDVFRKYGKLIKCDVKSKGTGNSFCFLEFEEEKEAEVSGKCDFLLSLVCCCFFLLSAFFVVVCFFPTIVVPNSQLFNFIRFVLFFRHI